MKHTKTTNQTKETLESLVEGDFVDCGDGDKRKVLGVCGQVFLLSMAYRHDAYDSGYTVKDLKEEGWKHLIQDEEEGELDEEAQEAIDLLTKKGLLKDGKILES